MAAAEHGLSHREGGTGGLQIPGRVEIHSACSEQGERAAVSRPDRLWLCSLQSGLLFIGIPALLIAVLRSLLRGSLLRERTCSKVPALAASVFSYRKY